MKHLWISLPVALLLFLSLDARAADPGARKAKLINADSQEIGEIALSETPNGVLVRLDLHDHPARPAPGAHAVHLHETGRCEPPFKSAGAHLNLSNKKHGFLNTQGAHTGDLPNLHVPRAGSFRVEMLIAQASLSGDKANLVDGDGFALVIHQGADDYKSDPAGDSGDRIACAAIEGPKAAK